MTDSQYKHRQTPVVQISKCHSRSSFTWASSCFPISSVCDKVTGSIFLWRATFQILHSLFWGQHTGNSQNRTDRTIHFLCKNWKKSLEGKTAYIWRWASTPCSWYLIMSLMHCMVYCWYKDDNFTDFVIRHIATKSELC